MLEGANTDDVAKLILLGTLNDIDGFPEDECRKRAQRCSAREGQGLVLYSDRMGAFLFVVLVSDPRS